ncbi:MAG: omptin family outer membrane protease [Desulfomonilaceae bacterium]
MICRVRTAIVATILIVVYICAYPLAAQAQGLNDPLDTMSGLVSTVGAKDWRYTIGFKKFFNSYTSYQFPNPFPPEQDPLSRLEFPIDQWFFGGAYIYNAWTWSASLDIWTNINKDSRSQMQDSDWDQENLPGQKSIFSESKCRLKRSWLGDLKFLLKPEVQLFKIVRPIFGVRYQTFSFVTHDGNQDSIDGYSVDLPGEGIEFDQSFYQYYVGGQLNTTLNNVVFSRLLTGLDIGLVVDYALVSAKNQDLHLLREGERITTEITNGHCWHAQATASFPMRDNIRMRLDVDFKRIVTNGDHQLTNSFFNVDFSFNGSRVWSDQLSAAATAELIF